MANLIAVRSIGVEIADGAGEGLAVEAEEGANSGLVKAGVDGIGDSKGVEGGILSFWERVEDEVFVGYCNKLGDGVVC